MQGKFSKKTCIIAVDVQKGFINSYTKDIPEKVEKLQHEYDYVLVTRFHNPAGSLFRTLLKWDGFDEASREVELAFTPRSDAIILTKTSYNCVDRKLLDFLRSKDINRVDICGINTDICVTQTAINLFDNDVVPVVLSEYCASTAGREAHLNALKTLRRCIGNKQVC